MKPSASKEAQRIPKVRKERIRKLINDLAKNPRPSGVKKLKGQEDFFRIRVGDYRILYTIDDKNKVIRILSILHRKEAYR